MAFLASGSRDLFAVISKVKILHGDPSSYIQANNQISPVGGVSEGQTTYHIPVL